MKSLLTLLLVALFFGNAYPDGNDAQKILEKVKSAYSKIKDYEVHVTVKVDVEFLKVPETEATIYFKQPDKMKIASDGFAMLPRQGFNFSPASLLNGDYTAILEKEETIDHLPCYVVKVIPNGDTKDVILTTLWIDKATPAIRKIETATKSNGTHNISLEYNELFIKQYPLPSAMTFSFDLSKTNFQHGFGNDMNDDKGKQKKNRPTKGTVHVYYSNYKINTGLSDSLFEDKKDSKKK